MRYGSTARVLLAASVLALTVAGAARAQEVKEEYQDYEQMELVPYTSSDSNAFTNAGPTIGGGPHVIMGFEGISQYDVASVARNFIPPDTMGAVGFTQYAATANGGFAVYDKATGARTLFESDLQFWANAGRSGANGDTRIMFNKDAGRWIAIAFGASVSQIQIAVSDTDNAAGTWKSTVYTGFANGIADYPTLALDKNAVYIGTNNFNSSGNFRGTTLSVIPLASLFNAGAPTTTGRAVVNTPYSPTSGGADGGFAIQGVNSEANTTQGHVIAASLFYDDVIRYNINGVNNLATATLSPTTYIGTADYGANNPGRQPNAVPDVCVTAGGCSFPDNNRVIDTLDQRIGSSVWEVNGRIYAVYTVTPLGGDHTYIRYDVVDAATNTILDEKEIGDGVHDYYQGSLAVNKYGQVVIGYNRSGSEQGTGNITFAAMMFSTGAGGKLTQRGDELVLKVSTVDDYHNGSTAGQVANGRQRWGDYSAVSVDPNDPRNFWLIGEWAREYNNAAGGHPGGTGGSRWSEWIAEIGVGTQVPEPSNWALLIAGFGLLGATMRRRRTTTVAA